MPLMNRLCVLLVPSVSFLAQKLSLRNGKNTAEHQINMSKLFLYSSIKNCQKAGEEVILSFANGDEKRILLMGLKRFTKGYNINPKEFLMVGNSLRSDILPVIKIGAYAVYIPYEITWEREMEHPEINPEHYTLIKSMGFLRSWLEKINRKK